MLSTAGSTDVRALYFLSRLRRFHAVCFLVLTFAFPLFRAMLRYHAHGVLCQSEPREAWRVTYVTNRNASVLLVPVAVYVGMGDPTYLTGEPFLLQGEAYAADRVHANFLTL